MRRSSHQQFGHIRELENYLDKTGAGSTRVRNKDGTQELWSDLGDTRKKALHVRTGPDGKIGKEQSTAIQVFLRLAGFMAVVLLILLIAALMM